MNLHYINWNCSIQQKIPFENLYLIINSKNSQINTKTVHFHLLKIIINKSRHFFCYFYWINIQKKGQSLKELKSSKEQMWIINIRFGKSYTKKKNRPNEFWTENEIEGKESEEWSGPRFKLCALWNESPTQIVLVSIFGYVEAGSMFHDCVVLNSFFFDNSLTNKVHWASFFSSSWQLHCTHIHEKRTPHK